MSGEVCPNCGSAQTRWATHWNRWALALATLASFPVAVVTIPVAIWVACPSALGAVGRAAKGGSSERGARAQGVGDG